MKHGLWRCPCDDCREYRRAYKLVWRRRNGVPPRRKRPPREPETVDEIAVERAVRGGRTVLNRAEQWDGFVYLDAHGYSAAQIAERLGIAERTVTRWRGKLRHGRPRDCRLRPSDSVRGCADDWSCRPHESTPERGADNTNAPRGLAS